jgi:hypothetical protein
MTFAMRAKVPSFTNDRNPVTTLRRHAIGEEVDCGSIAPASHERSLCATLAI